MMMTMMMIIMMIMVMNDDDDDDEDCDDLNPCSHCTNQAEINVVKMDPENYDNSSLS